MSGHINGDISQNWTATDAELYHGVLISGPTDDCLKPEKVSLVLGKVRYCRRKEVIEDSFYLANEELMAPQFLGNVTALMTQYLR